jgi:hypothetical protein
MAEREAVSADVFRYDCPEDKPYEVVGSREAVLEQDKVAAEEARKWVARQRQIHPNAIPRLI